MTPAQVGPYLVWRLSLPMKNESYLPNRLEMWTMHMGACRCDVYICFDLWGYISMALRVYIYTYTYTYIYIIYICIYIYVNTCTRESIHRNINTVSDCDMYDTSSISQHGYVVHSSIVPCLLPCHLALKNLAPRWPDVDTSSMTENGSCSKKCEVAIF